MSDLPRPVARLRVQNRRTGADPHGQEPERHLPYPQGNERPRLSGKHPSLHTRAVGTKLGLRAQWAPEGGEGLATQVLQADRHNRQRARVLLDSGSNPPASSGSAQEGHGGVAPRPGPISGHATVIWESERGSCDFVVNAPRQGSTTCSAIGHQRRRLGAQRSLIRPSLQKDCGRIGPFLKVELDLNFGHVCGGQVMALNGMFVPIPWRDHPVP